MAELFIPTSGGAFHLTGSPNREFSSPLQKAVLKLGYAGYPLWEVPNSGGYYTGAGDVISIANRMAYENMPMEDAIAWYNGEHQKLLDRMGIDQATYDKLMEPYRHAAEPLPPWLFSTISSPPGLTSAPAPATTPVTPPPPTPVTPPPATTPAPASNPTLTQITNPQSWMPAVTGNNAARDPNRVTNPFANTSVSSLGFLGAERAKVKNPFDTSTQYNAPQDRMSWLYDYNSQR